MKFVRAKSPAYSSSAYNSAGGTLSEKNAVKEYCLKIEDINRGVEEGKLKVQWRSCHGNSYRLLVRSEVSAFAKTCTLDPKLHAKKNAAALKEIDAELQQQELTKASLLAKKAAILEGKV